MQLTEEDVDDGRPYSARSEDFADIGEGICWECIMCGKCCGNIFTETWLDAALIDFVGEPVDGYCRHLNRAEMRCMIHDRRPNICRGYPFILKKVGDHYRLQVHLKCPGIGRGETVDVRKKTLEIVKLAEDDTDHDFLIQWASDDSDIKLYMIK